MDDVRYTYKSECSLKEQKLNEKKIEQENELGKIKDILGTVRTERDQAILNYEQERKISEDL